MMNLLMQLSLSVILGTLIGLERQWRQRMAGLRTNALVSLGATLFCILSIPNMEPTVKTEIETPIEETLEETTLEETINEKSKKKSFIVADYTKEYEWVLTEEIENEAPLKFIFTLATNKEIANYNDNLMRIEGNGVVTYQNLVDIELLNLKLKRIENIELNGEVETVTDKNRINFIIDKVFTIK